MKEIDSITLHYTEFKVNNAEALQTLYSQFEIYSQNIDYGKDAKKKMRF